ncbi:MAG: hypothetical protein P1V20_28365 [Verrucomicrobiales bacterium]|nr:hypothetical protein [Verrucomicrobiales bacterium]
MNLYTLWRKSQKWTISAVIFIGSTAMFLFWWMKGEVSPQHLHNHQPVQLVQEPPLDVIPTVDAATAEIAVAEPEKIRPEARAKRKTVLASVNPLKTKPPQPPVTINPQTMLIGGRDLFSIENGKLVKVRENWLAHEVRTGDEAVYLTHSDRIAVGGSKDSIQIYETSGSYCGNLTMPGGGTLDGYITKDLNAAIYLREGNIWRGIIDWQHCIITQEEQITNTGCFLGKPLKARLLAATGKAMLYRDHRYGLVHVNLDTGETQSGKLPVNSVRGPEQRLVLGDLSTHPPQLVVFDADTGKENYIPMASRIMPNGVHWLGEGKAAVILRNHIGLYDHADGSLKELYGTESRRETVRYIAASKPGQPYVFFEHSTNGIHMLHTKTKALHQIRSFTVHGLELLTGGYFLLNSDVAEADRRGTWLGRFGEPELQRIFAQPVKGRYASTQPTRNSIILKGDSNSVIVHAFNDWHLLNLRSAEIQKIPITGKELIAIR